MAGLAWAEDCKCHIDMMLTVAASASEHFLAVIVPYSIQYLLQTVVRHSESSKDHTDG